MDVPQLFRYVFDLLMMYWFFVPLKKKTQEDVPGKEKENLVREIAGYGSLLLLWEFCAGWHLPVKIIFF